jgi:spermidine synthase
MSRQDWFIEYFEPSNSCFGLKVVEKLHHEVSDYQTIEVYLTESFGHLLVLDGCTMLTERDHFIYHEMMTHPALLTHADPQQVAIIGGGDGGVMSEVVKHPGVRRVTQIELDERVSVVSEQFYPELTAVFHHPKAEMIFTDGFKWIQQMPDDALDVLIVDSTDPIGPAEILFSSEFLRECTRVLKPDGILVQQSESPLIHGQSLLAPLHKGLRSLGMNSVKTLNFPQPIYPTGWWSSTLSSAQGDLSLQRVMPDLQTRYYSADMHKAAAVLPPFLMAQLD